MKSFKQVKFIFIIKYKQDDRFESFSFCDLLNFVIWKFSLNIKGEDDLKVNLLKV